ncbi:MAG: gliding motility lipoprotein GldH [Chitinophagaceae bacterium]|nr:gliding motility lipoprotein GldH [Chitinophagaceae bacterium]
MRIVFNFLVVSLLLLSSCGKVDLYEKHVSIPAHAWSSEFKPVFDFEITDSTAEYQLFFLIRHNDKYNYSNIFFNLYSQTPGDSSLRKAPFEITLATDSKGWLGSGLDDIYEHRHPLTNFVRLRPGKYHFELEQIMREDPLQHVLSVGLRLEKTK